MIIYDDNLLSILNCDLFPLIYNVTMMSSDRSNDTHSYCTYPCVVFCHPVFPWWLFAGAEYHTIIFVALAEQLGLTCLLLITWLCSLRSFRGYV